MYEDERIVFLRKIEIKKKFNSVGTGMYVENKLYYFENSTIFNGQVECKIPSGFKDMDIKSVKNKYPSENRPQVIKTDEDGEVDLTFSLFKQPVQIDQMKGTIDSFQIMIRKAQPANQFISDGKMELKADMLCHWFDFKSYAVDNTVYNLLFIINIDETLLLGMFNCPYNKYLHWKPVMLELIKTINEEDTNEID